MSGKKERSVSNETGGQVVLKGQEFLTATTQETEQRFVEEHRAVKCAFKEMLHHAKTAGELLAIEKRRLKANGMFTFWLKNVCERYKIHVSTAYDYMRISEQWEIILENAAKAGMATEELSINKALKLIETQEEVMEKAKATAQKRLDQNRISLEKKAADAGQNRELVAFALDHWQEVRAAAEKEGVDLNGLDKDLMDGSLSNKVAAKALDLVRKVKQAKERREQREQLPPGSLVLLINGKQVEELEADRVAIIQAAMTHWKITTDITHAIGFLLSVGKNLWVYDCEHPTVTITEEIGASSQTPAKATKAQKMPEVKANPKELEQTEVALPAK